MDNLGDKLNNNDLVYRHLTSKNLEDYLNSDSYKKSKKNFFKSSTNNYDNKLFNVRFNVNNNNVENF